MKYIRHFLVLITLAFCHQAQTAFSQNLPSGYLYKVERGVSGKTVYICGQRPFNANGVLVGAGNVSSQLRQIFENLKTSLATVGMTLQDITQIKYSVKVVAATSPNQVGANNAQILANVGASYLSSAPKIVDMKSVSQTVRDDVLIEVEVITVK